MDCSSCDDFDTLCQEIAAGRHDIDVERFRARLNLDEDWDWGDVENGIKNGEWTAPQVHEHVHRALRGD